MAHRVDPRNPIPVIAQVPSQLPLARQAHPLRDHLHLGNSLATPKKSLFERFKDWCSETWTKIVNFCCCRKKPTVQLPPAQRDFINRVLPQNAQNLPVNQELFDFYRQVYQAIIPQDEANRIQNLGIAQINEEFRAIEQLNQGPQGDQARLLRENARRILLEIRLAIINRETNGQLMERLMQIQNQAMQNNPAVQNMYRELQQDPQRFATMLNQAIQAQNQQQQAPRLVTQLAFDEMKELYQGRGFITPDEVARIENLNLDGVNAQLQQENINIDAQLNLLGVQPHALERLEILERSHNFKACTGLLICRRGLLMQQTVEEMREEIARFGRQVRPALDPLERPAVQQPDQPAQPVQRVEPIVPPVDPEVARNQRRELMAQAAMQRLAAQNQPAVPAVPPQAPAQPVQGAGAEVQAPAPPAQAAAPIQPVQQEIQRNLQDGTPLIDRTRGGVAGSIDMVLMDVGDLFNQVRNGNAAAPRDIITYLSINNHKILFTPFLGADLRFGRQFNTNRVIIENGEQEGRYKITEIEMDQNRRVWFVNTNQEFVLHNQIPLADETVYLSEDAVRDWAQAQGRVQHLERRPNQQ